MVPRSNKIAINRNVNIVCDDDETVWLEFVYLFDSIRIIVGGIDKSSNASYLYYILRVVSTFGPISFRQCLILMIVNYYC